MEIEFVVQDMYALTRPQWKLASDLEEAAKAWQVAIIQQQKLVGLEKAQDVDDQSSSSSSDEDNGDGDLHDGDDDSGSEDEDIAEVCAQSLRILYIFLLGFLAVFSCWFLIRDVGS
jgi:regulator of nonsense transcripts 2